MCYPFVIFACITVKMFNSATLGKPSSTFKFRNNNITDAKLKGPGPGLGLGLGPGLG